MGILLPWSKCPSGRLKGVGDVRFEDDLRFHFKVGPAHFVLGKKNPAKAGFSL